MGLDAAASRTALVPWIAGVMSSARLSVVSYVSGYVNVSGKQCKLLMSFKRTCSSTKGFTYTRSVNDGINTLNSLVQAPGTLEVGNFHKLKPAGELLPRCDHGLALLSRSRGPADPETSAEEGVHDVRSNEASGPGHEDQPTVHCGQRILLCKKYEFLTFQ